MTRQVPVRLTDKDVAALDAAIAAGRFASRSEALRAGLDQVLRAEREREIDADYRRGYGANPQEEWIGAIGLAALEAFDRSQGDEEL
jgi:Arc/MetJ-type ribon-helix-helix transcriptional regulator